MAFRLFLIYSFLLIGRPQDVLTWLQPMRPALVFALLALAAALFGVHRQELARALATAEARRYFLFFLIMIIGIPFAYNKGVAFQSVSQSYIANMVFFVILIVQVTSLQRLKSLIWVVCLSTVLYSVSGVILRDGGEARLAVYGNVFDPNDTAYVLLALFPLSMFFILCNEGVVKRLVAIAAIFGAIAVILQTGSRGGGLGLGTVLLLLFVTNAGGLKKGSKMLLGAMLASSWILIGDRIDIDRYLTLSDISSDYNVSSEGGRLELWRAAIDLSLANPVTGVGTECFPYAHFLIRQLAGDSYLRWHAVHNSFLQVAAEVGLIGFGVFVLINLSSLRTFARVSRIQIRPESPASSEIGALGGLMLLGFVGMVVSGFFLSQAYSIYSTLYFALAITIGRLEEGARMANGVIGGAGPASRDPSRAARIANGWMSSATRLRA